MGEGGSDRRRVVAGRSAKGAAGSVRGRVIAKGDPQELVRRTREGDPEALGQFLGLHYQDLLRATQRMMGFGTRALVDAEDLLQDGVLAAMSSLSQFKGGGVDAFKGWMLGIVRNQIRHLRRFNREKRRPRANTSLPPALHTFCGAEFFEGVAGRGRDRDRVGSPRELEFHREYRLLGNPHRLALVLRETLDLSWSTVALILDHPSEEAARQLHYRARVSIREAVVDVLGGTPAR